MYILDDLGYLHISEDQVGSFFDDTFAIDSGAMVPTTMHEVTKRNVKL
jgi:hypothetical protein